MKWGMVMRRTRVTMCCHAVFGDGMCCRHSLRVAAAVPADCRCPPLPLLKPAKGCGDAHTPAGAASAAGGGRRAVPYMNPSRRGAIAGRVLTMAREGARDHAAFSPRSEQAPDAGAAGEEPFRG
eukprot:gene16117-biopygen12721